jgi:hypothetical protein
MSQQTAGPQFQPAHRVDKHGCVPHVFPAASAGAPPELATAPAPLVPPVAPPAPPVPEPPRPPVALAPALAPLPDEPPALASVVAPPAFDLPPVRAPPEAVDPDPPPAPTRPPRPPLDADAFPEPPFSDAPVPAVPGVTLDDVVSSLQPGAIQSVAPTTQKNLEASNRKVTTGSYTRAMSSALACDLLRKARSSTCANVCRSISRPCDSRAQLRNFVRLAGRESHERVDFHFAFVRRLFATLSRS